MGRNKIKIEKKSASQQHVTYGKRKAGIAKKARELAILCDTDVLLLTMSPRGKPDLVLGPKTKFEDVIHKYANQIPAERLKKKRECLQALSKAFRSDKDHEVDVEQLMKLGTPETPSAFEGLQQVLNLNQQIDEAKKLLGPLVDIEKVYEIDNLDRLISMEEAINNLIKENRMRKLAYMRLRQSQHFLTQEEMNSAVALNGGGISHSTLHPRNWNDSISNIRPTSQTKANCSANASNMLPQLIEGTPENLHQRDVAETPVSVSAPSIMAPQEEIWNDLMNFNFSEDTQDVASHEVGFSKWASTTNAFA